MKCLECGNEMIEDTRDITYTYKGNVLTIKAINAEFCTCCEEIIFDSKETKRYMQEVAAFQKEINNQLASPKFILHIRKKLGLDQRQAAKLFGGGVNSFSRYETGKVSPPIALVQLLRVLDKHPELLEELRT